MPRTAAVTAILLLPSLTACANVSSDPGSPASGPGTATRASSAPVLEGLDAERVVDGFTEAGLPTPAARDNSRNCKRLGCVSLITTDAISVYQWPDEASARH